MATSFSDKLSTKAPATAKVPTKFRNKGLHQFFKADGSRVAPVDGYYIPKDAEEWDLLAHYAEVHDLVVPE